MARIRKNYENSIWSRLVKWVEEGSAQFDIDKIDDPAYTSANQPHPDENQRDAKIEHEYITTSDIEFRKYRKFYRIFSVIFGITLISLLIITISYIPPVGDASNPDNTVVSERYIEKGLEETGAVNIVAGMILDYRAFDTFGESCVLFSALVCVLILLKNFNDESDFTEPFQDSILRASARLLIPIIIIFGMYIILNGHLSAGGGFSGGAVMGSGLILYAMAFGYDKSGGLITEKRFKAVTLSALSFYCLAKSYSFFCGANGIESHIPLGTPGAIISAGLILPLNICVGLVVACTMYGFFIMFRRGKF